MVAQCLNLIDKVEKLLQILEDDLWHYRYALIILRVNVSAVFGADVSCLNAHEGGIVALDAAKQLMVDAAVHIVGMALQWGKVDRNHRLQNCEKVARKRSFL